MTCAVCTAPTRDEARLCDQHIREIERAVADMPALLHELDVTLTRQDRISSGKRGADTPLPYNPDAAEMHWVAVNTLTTWARHLAETRGVQPPTAADMVPWLLRYSGAIRMDEAAAEIHDEITWLHRELHRAIDRPATRWYAGTCGAPVLGLDYDPDTAAIVPEADTCQAELFVAYDRATVTCRACGAHYDVASRRQELIDTARDRLMPLDDILAAMPTLLGYQPMRATVRKWKSRARLVAAGLDLAGQELYRVGDLIDLAEQSEEIRQRREKTPA